MTLRRMTLNEVKLKSWTFSRTTKHTQNNVKRMTLCKVKLSIWDTHQNNIKQRSTQKYNVMQKET
jgi:hypothetical protein